MKQVVQNIRNGKLSLKEIPEPIVKPGHILIANAFVLVPFLSEVSGPFFSVEEILHPMGGLD